MANQLIPGAHLHHIALRTLDFERSKEFYVKGLGFTPIAQWGNEARTICMLEAGDGGRIELFSNSSGSLPENYEQCAGSFFHLAIGVEDVDAAYEKALSAGARSKIAPKNSELGENGPIVRLAFVYGPSGEQIEFFSKK